MLWTQSATLDGDIGVLQNEIEARMRLKFLNGEERVCLDFTIVQF